MPGVDKGKSKPKFKPLSTGGYAYTYLTSPKCHIYTYSYPHDLYINVALRLYYL